MTVRLARSVARASRPGRIKVRPRLTLEWLVGAERGHGGRAERDKEKARGA